MGYGKRALQQLIDYYSGNIPNLHEDSVHNGKIDEITDNDIEENLMEEVIKPRKNLPPLLLKLSERAAENLDYLGVSYGLTSNLLKYVYLLYVTFVCLSVCVSYSLFFLKFFEVGNS